MSFALPTAAVFVVCSKLSCLNMAAVVLIVVAVVTAVEHKVSYCLKVH